MKKILFVIATVLALAGCQRSPSNVHVLTTSNCGADWRVIPTGSNVPRAVGMCSYNTALPNWPMAGDAEFRSQFKHNVLTRIRVSYVYDIVDPIAYIQEARYLGKMSGSLEISSDDIGNRFELAENTIIDKRIREIVTDKTRNIDVVTMDTGVLEAEVQKEMTEKLKKNGINFGDIALVVEMDDLTRMSIDTVAALRLFEAAGEAQAGREILKARAGAPQIQVSQEAGKTSSK